MMTLIQLNTKIKSFQSRSVLVIMVTVELKIDEWCGLVDMWRWVIYEF